MWRFGFCSAFFLCHVVGWSEPADAQGAVDITPKASEAPGAPDGQKITLYAASKALVIGIDSYTRGWPKLSMAVKDAEEVGKALEAEGFKVTLLKDLKSDDFDRVFRDFFINEGANVDERLLVWFAGHGHTIQGEGYLVPADAPHPRLDVDFRRKALSLRRFGEYMREARAKHVLAVFDSCFAGSVFNVARAIPPAAITLSTALPVRQFVSSGEAEQTVSDDGTFRRLFIDALQGNEPAADANNDGFITGSELGQFLFDKMTNLTNTKQTPRYGKLNALGYDRGDFVFETKKLKAPAFAAIAPASPTPSPQALNEAVDGNRVEADAKRKTEEARKKANADWVKKRLEAGDLSGLRVSLDYDNRSEDLQAGRGIGRIVNSLNGSIVAPGAQADVTMGVQLRVDIHETIGKRLADAMLKLNCQVPILNVNEPCFVEQLVSYGSGEGPNFDIAKEHAIDNALNGLEKQLLQSSQPSRP